MKIGDWVEVSLSDRKIIGFVDCVIKKYIYINKVCVQWTDGEQVFIRHKNVSSYHKDNCKVIDHSIHHDDGNVLIDFAIDNNDKDWFLSLSQRMGKA